MGACNSANCGVDGINVPRCNGKGKKVPARARGKFLDYNEDGRKIRGDDDDPPSNARPPRPGGGDSVSLSYVHSSIPGMAYASVQAYTPSRLASRTPRTVKSTPRIRAKDDRGAEGKSREMDRLTGRLGSRVNQRPPLGAGDTTNDFGLTVLSHSVDVN